MVEIEINSSDWTNAEFRADWADDTETASYAAELADSQYAWLINNTATTLPGWRYTGNGFVGQLRADAPEKILALLSDAVDYALSVLPEIKAEAAQAAGCVYHRDHPEACSAAGAGHYRVSGDVWCAEALRDFAAEMGQDDPAVTGAVKLA